MRRPVFSVLLLFLLIIVSFTFINQFSIFVESDDESKISPNFLEHNIIDKSNTLMNTELSLSESSEMAYENIILNNENDILNQKKIQYDNMDISQFRGFISNENNIKNNQIYYHTNFNGLLIGYGESKIIFVYDTTSDSNITGSYSFEISFVNSNLIKPIGEDLRNNYVNYFVGLSSFSNIPVFDKIVYPNLYDGIDLVYYNNGEGLKYDFIVHPNADPSLIEISVSNDMKLDVTFDNIKIFNGEFNIALDDKNLQSFQNDVLIPSYFSKLSDNSYGFVIPEYNSEKTLIIDPLILESSTLFGGSEGEYGTIIELYNSNILYVAGTTPSNNFPMQSGFDTTYNGQTDVFIMKFNLSTNTELFSTYLGGSNYDRLNSHESGFHVDENGTIYLSGRTSSSNFPTYSAFDNSHNGKTDTFVTKINSDGNLILFSTFLGGSDSDYPFDLTLNKDGDILVYGHTYSDNFPTLNAYQDVRIGNLYELFITKISNHDYQMESSTYFGGRTSDIPVAMVVDDDNNVIISGHTYSDDFPTVNAIQPSFGGGIDIFISKFNHNITTLLSSTYIGGENLDELDGLVLQENEYVIGGITSSDDFPIVSGNQIKTNYASIWYMMRLSNSLDEIMYSTKITNTNSLYIDKFKVDEEGNLYYTTTTDVDGLPVKSEISSQVSGERDIYFVKFDMNAENIIFASYLGGNYMDTSSDFVVTNDGNLILGGSTGSVDFPGNTDGTINGVLDSFYAVISTPTSISIYSPEHNKHYSSDSSILSYSLSKAGLIDQIEIILDGVTNNSALPTNSVFENLEDGLHNLTIVIDYDLNKTLRKEILFTVDKIDPVIDITSPVMNSFTSGEVNLIYSIEETNIKETIIYVNNIRNQSDIPSDTILSLVNGLNNITIYVIDFSGRINIVFSLFNVDSTPPSISIQSPLNNIYNSKAILVDFTISDGDSRIFINMILQTDENINHNVFTFIEGLNNLTVIATDALGNSAKTTVIFSIDLTEPIISINLIDGAVYHTEIIELVYSISDISGFRTAVYVDGEVNVTAMESGSKILLKEGSHNVTIVAEDVVGHTAESITIFEIVLLSESPKSPQSLVSIGYANSFVLLIIGIMVRKRYFHNEIVK